MALWFLPVTRNCKLSALSLALLLAACSGEAPDQLPADTVLRGGAKALRLEDDAGSIARGKSADIIVIDRNLFEIPISGVGETQVLQTFFEGRLVYERGLSK